MKVISCYSSQIDPYRAGVEIAQQLIELNPEVIFLFATIHYNESNDLLDAIYTVLDNPKLIIIGGSSAGVYELNQSGIIAVTALGINSYGTISWFLEFSDNIRQNPAHAASKCIKTINSRILNSEFNSEANQLLFIFSDFRTDASHIISAINKHTSTPLIGGLTGDDEQFDSAYIYINGNILTDSLALLAAVGNFEFNILVLNNYHTIGSPGCITKADGQIIHSINNKPAKQFIEEKLGRALNKLDNGTITLLAKEDPHSEKKSIHSFVVEDDLNETSVKLFSGLKQGRWVQVSQTTINHIKNSLTHSNFQNINPNSQNIMLISCTGRKHILQGDFNYELMAIKQHFPNLKALSGFLSFGEIGPVKLAEETSETMFHNMTLIALFLGDNIT